MVNLWSLQSTLIFKFYFYKIRTRIVHTIEDKWCTIKGSWSCQGNPWYLSFVTYLSAFGYQKFTLLSKSYALQHRLPNTIWTCHNNKRICILRNFFGNVLLHWKIYKSTTMVVIDRFVLFLHRRGQSPRAPSSNLSVVTYLQLAINV